MALRPHLLTVAVAAAVFGLGFNGGTYSLVSRGSVAVGVWWAIVMGVGLALWPLSRVPRAAVVAGGLLALFAVWTGVSALWADSAEKAFTELDRVTLYLGIFVLAVAVGRRANVRRFADGIAFGITAVALLSLTSRLFPHFISPGDISRFFPGDPRPSYPVNYWNGLAILVALAIPLLLRPAIAAPGAVRRGLAIAPIPAIASVVYLTSSRSGTATAVAGTLLFVVLTNRRLAAAAAAAIAAVGSVGAIAVLEARSTLVNGPFDSSAAFAQGRSAAIWISAICAAAALVHGFGSRLSLPTPRLGRRLKLAIAALVIVFAVGGTVAAHPAKRFDTFKQPPSAASGGSYTSSHLLSGGGNGRWQFWQAAVDEFKTKPIAGRGAGSYAAWWAQNGTISYFTRNAHSLYLETLGELGIVGLALVLAAFGSGIASLGRRLRVGPREDRSTVAALGAAFIAFAVAAGLDWMWQLTVVGVVGVALLGLLVGPATASGEPARAPRSQVGTVSRLRRYFGWRTGVVILGLLVIVGQAIPLLAQTKISDSQKAAGRGDTAVALRDARAARDAQPWAASPYLQLALVQEQSFALEDARASFARAIDRDPSDWQLWLVDARIEGSLGATDAARRSLDKAVALNPRSSLFASLPHRSAASTGTQGN